MGLPQMTGDDPLRKIVFPLGMALIFIRFSWFHNLQAMVCGFNMGLLYLTGIPAMLGVLVSGGIQRTLQSKIAKCWMLAIVWMGMAAVMSTWKGNSVPLYFSHLKTNVGMLFIMAGLVRSWDECTKVMKTLSWAALMSLAYAYFFSKGEGDRLALSFGMISNANDLAAHLVLMEGFLLWMVMRSKSVILKLVALGGGAVMLVMILQTASRGALVALAVMALVAFVIGTGFQRVLVMLAVVAGLATLFSAIPPETRDRLLTFSTTEGNAEAAMSAALRRQVLMTSLRYAVERPLFGVGLGQYAIYEVMHERVGNMNHGLGTNGHNSYVTVAADCGLVEEFFYLSAIVASFVVVFKTHRKAKGPLFRDIRATTFCTLLAMAGYFTAITFINFGYMFYQLALSGLAIAISLAAEQEFQNRKAAQPVAAAPASPWVGAGQRVTRRVQPASY